jgi:NAD(P)H dehydrogenase (quinone)
MLLAGLGRIELPDAVIMKILLILGHQRPGSFCHAIAETARAELCAAGHEVIYHDLYAEGFDPVLPDAEIAKNAELTATIAQHCRQVVEAEVCIVVHPNWWAMPPAVLKGWVDRVFRQGVVYEFGPQGVIGKLKGKQAIVFTTSNTPREDELRLFGDPLENLWKTCVFGFCGVENFYRRNFESIVMSTPEQRAAWLEEVRQVLREKV